MAGVLAYVNHGRWVADCPECGGGILVRIVPSERVDRTTCRDCGSEVGIVRPDDEVVAAGEDVLSRRRPENRNWDPSRETVADLKAENARYGVSFTGGR